MHKEMFRRSARQSAFFICLSSAIALSGCGGGFDGGKDLFGAIGFKLGGDPIVAPGDVACGAGTGSGTASAGLPSGRCLSAAEAANAIAQQCPDCSIVLEFKGTNESTYCGSIALSAGRNIFGAASGPSAKNAQENAMSQCVKAEAAATSSCTIVKTRCL